MATNYKQVLSQSFDATKDALKVVAQAATNVIGKVRLVTALGHEVTDDTLDAVKTRQRHSIVEVPFTGTGNVVVGTAKITPGAAFRLVEVELTITTGGAPTTGTQNFVLTKDDGVGTAYDNVLLSLDLVANAVTSLSFKPKKSLKATDVVTAAWTNTDGRTYGLIFKYELE